MRTITLAAIFVPLVLSMSGCAGIAFTGRSAGGFIYTEASLPESATSNAPGPKTGTSCAQSILGWVTTGDASTAAAAKAGGIRKIASVDNKTTNILGVYATYCVVVTGE